MDCLHWPGGPRRPSGLAAASGLRRGSAGCHRQPCIFRWTIIPASGWARFLKFVHIFQVNHLPKDQAGASFIINYWNETLRVFGAEAVVLDREDPVHLPPGSKATSLRVINKNKNDSSLGSVCANPACRMCSPQYCAAYCSSGYGVASILFDFGL